LTTIEYNPELYKFSYKVNQPDLPKEIDNPLDSCNKERFELLLLFDKNSVRGVETPNFDTNTTIQTHTHRLQTDRRGDIEL